MTLIAGSMHAKLDSVLKTGSWSWKPARSEDLVVNQSRLPEVHIGEVDRPV
jgi:hypothetical protein